MSERFVNVDRQTPMLLPQDLREWVDDDDLVHFVIESVEGMQLPSVEVNRRGSGSEQYPPSMLLALLIYCYANGMFASRRIEQATYRDVAVRYLTGNTHPDHDTICSFRRRNGKAIKETFLQVLKLAKEMKLLKVGTVSVDGTHIKANASKHKGLRYDRAVELEGQLGRDIDALLAQAERSDSSAEDAQRLPEEIGRRSELKRRIAEARQKLEERARAEATEHSPDDGGEGKDVEGSGGGPKPRAAQQINLTDADSRLMRKSHHDGYIQGYNAQAVVDAEGSQLVLGCEVIQSPSDANELESALRQLPAELGTVERTLADAGYVNVAALKRIEESGTEVYVAVAGEDNSYRQYDFRPAMASGRRKKKVTDEYLLAMQQKIRSPEGRRIYGRRASTVEPVFGIIKRAMGFRQFLLRGLRNVSLEWDLVCLAYNVRRLYALSSA